MTPGRFALVLAAFGCQRLLELAYSVKNERQIQQQETNAPRPEGFRWIVLTNVGLFTLPVLERSIDRSRPIPPMLRAIGWAGGMAALGLRLSVLWTLRERWTVRAVVPKGLVVADDGPYRFIRHPNYVALAIEFATLPLLGGAYRSAAGLSLVNGLLLARRIREEETLLLGVPGYRERMATKPRFVPRLVKVSAQKAAPATRGA